MQQLPSRCGNLFVVDKLGIGAVVGVLAIGLIQQSVLAQLVQVDHQRISSERRERLIRRISVARRTDGQHLPPTLPRRLQPVDKSLRGLAERADTVRRRQRGNVHKHSAASSIHKDHLQSAYLLGLSAAQHNRGKNYRTDNHRPDRKKQYIKRRSARRTLLRGLVRLYRRCRHIYATALFGSSEYLLKVFSRDPVADDIQQLPHPFICKQLI